MWGHKHPHKAWKSFKNKSSEHKIKRSFSVTVVSRVGSEAYRDVTTSSCLQTGAGHQSHVPAPWDKLSHAAADTVVYDLSHMIIEHSGAQ